MNFLRTIFAQANVFEYGIIDTKDICFSTDVRKMCETNACQQYGKTWCCPPAVGSVEQCRERIGKYEKFILFSQKYHLEDSFDFEGMVNGLTQFKRTCRTLDEMLHPKIKDYFILSNEGCDLCKTCTYPNAPCRFPDKAHHSLEGYGLLVSDLAKSANMHYVNGANTVTYFGALICNSAMLKM